MTTPESDSPGTYINGQVMYPRSYVEELEKQLVEAEKKADFFAENYLKLAQRLAEAEKVVALAAAMVTDGHCNITSKAANEYQTKWKVEG